MMCISVSCTPERELSGGRRYETTNHLWLILEYCVGGNLGSLLQKDIRLPESSTHDFGRDLSIALQARSGQRAWASAPCAVCTPRFRCHPAWQRAGTSRVLVTHMKPSTTVC